MELSQNLWGRAGVDAPRMGRVAGGRPSGTFTNAAIARGLEVKPPNVTKYLNALMERRFVYPHHREGRQIFYRASEDVRIIRDLPGSQALLSG